MTVLFLFAVLVPGLSLADQPHIDYPVVTEIWEWHGYLAEPTPPRAVEEGREEPAGEPSPAAPSVWDSLAECESGNWVDGGASFEAGSARWDWGRPGVALPPWGSSLHHGGLQFAPSTWNWVAPMVGLGHLPFAYEATREQQIQVATRVQELQGWGAWPVCSRKLGLR